MQHSPLQMPDWNLLWQQARHNKSWQSKGESDWDDRAAAFARRTETSAYTNAFISLLKPDPGWSILDVGSGPGTLAIPLSPMVRQITCLDFSVNMLKILETRATTLGLANIETRKGAWTDDWYQLNIRPHDVVIASRSLSVTDLGAALVRLTEFGLHKIVVTDRVGHGPFDPDAFAALGRPLNTGPDYIYTFNLLYQMGHLASVDFISLKEDQRYPSLDEAFARYAWMFRDLSVTEIDCLHRYVREIAAVHKDGSVTLHSRHVTTWAYISWHPALSR